VFDDIIIHPFTAPGTYETRHKGFSPLEFLPKTHADVQDETLGGGNRHQQAIMVRTGFFTKWSNLMLRQETELNHQH
jgi:hypothetical protein